MKTCFHLNSLARPAATLRGLVHRCVNGHRVYVRFDHVHKHRRSKKGVWQNIFEQLSKDPNNEYNMITSEHFRIDSTIARAHRSSAGARKKGALPKNPKHVSTLVEVVAG